MDRKYIRIAAVASVLVLAACSSSDKSDPESDSNADTSDLIVGESKTGILADDVATDDLRRSAARFASDSLGLNINEVLGIPFFASSSSDVFSGSETTNTNTGETDTITSGSTVGDSIENGDTLDDNIDSLMTTSLALDSTVAIVTREGNVITIDPDENELCQEEVLGNMIAADAGCVAVYKDLLVVLDAKTDDTGLLTYQFQETPVLVIGYSPNGGSYEINMGGLKAVLEASAAQDPDTTVDLPDTMQGAMRVTAMVNDDSGVTAAGSMSLSVTQPISIIDTDGDINLSLGNSELFKVSSDTEGNTKISSNYGALSASFPAILDSANPTKTDMVALMVSGFTNQLDINKAGDEVKLGNSGSALTVAINSGEAVKLSISSYAITLNSDSLSIDEGLTLGVSLSNVVGQLTNGALNSAQLDIAMPTGTVLAPDDASGSTKVSAGAFSYNLQASSAQGAVSNSFSASAGECFTSNSGTNSTDGSTDPNPAGSDAPLVLVSCGAP